ncbi:HNH endonuclease [Teredinibacter turnerae]|uniref:HNH endonuclease n=1 Tax=Teredinibacter turnerae TaxID=2426 RepID=UPI000421181C|nr:HNH endonuclease signature motif containing protein [Teredinibacter turnerae]
MGFSVEKRQAAYDRTDGHCHICRKKLAFENYGTLNGRGAWEIEHSKPRSKGGTDHGNNLYAACISCNRSKNNGSTRAARAKNGFKAAPYSQKKKVRNSATGAGIFGAAAWLIVPPQIRIPAALISAAIGGSLGFNEEPE